MSILQKLVVFQMAIHTPAFAYFTQANGVEHQVLATNKLQVKHTINIFCYAIRMSVSKPVALKHLIFELSVSETYILRIHKLRTLECVPLLGCPLDQEPF